jgi:predicted ATP-dependent serine protease
MKHCKKCGCDHEEVTRLCIPCKIKKRIYDKTYASKPENTEKLRAKAKAWKKANPDKVKTYNKKTVSKEL